MKNFHLHLVSDSTGETVASVARACMAQFNDAAAEEHVWSLMRTKGQLEKMIASLDTYPGMVMFTLMDHEMREHLRQAEVPIYRDVLMALRGTQVSTVVYGDVYIDINGCDSIRNAVRF